MNCQRCKDCCLKCGTNFWTHGNPKADGKPFGTHILLNKLAHGCEHQDDGLPCEMLNVVGHKTFCAIERYAGEEFKPLVCREFPDIREECFFVKVEAGPLDRNTHDSTA